MFLACSGGAGGCWHAGVLLELCHPEFPASPITRWPVSIKNTSRAFLLRLQLYCFTIIPQKKASGRQRVICEAGER